MEKLLSTHCVSPAGRYLGISLLLWGLAQGLQRSIATRQRASELCMLEGRSKQRKLSPSGEPSGVPAEDQGPTARTL